MDVDCPSRWGRTVNNHGGKRSCEACIQRNILLALLEVIINHWPDKNKNKKTRTR